MRHCFVLSEDGQVDNKWREKIQVLQVTEVHLENSH